MDKIVLQNYGLYIYSNVLDIIYNYADESLHKDYMDHLIGEIESCVATTMWYNPYAQYIYMTIDEKNKIGFPTNITSPEYDNHNKIVYGIKEKFKRIKYYKYKLNGGWKCYQIWKDELL